MNNIDIVEQSGYSYSGVVDIMQSNPELLIQELDKQYNETKDKIASLKKETSQLESLRSRQVSLFRHIASYLETDKLVFNDAEKITVVEIKENNKINYDKFPITKLK